MVLNIFKITGNAPEIAEKMWQIFFDILQDGQVDWPMKELLILKSTKIGDCMYCVTQHEVVSGRLRVSEEKQADIVGVEYRKSPHYTEAERAILDLCGHPVLDPESIPADVWSRVHEHYDDGQIVEIVATIDVATADVEETFVLAESRFDMVPNLVKVLGTNPTMCRSVTAFLTQALQDGRVSWAFKELVILKTLRSIGVYYSYVAHERLATELGNSPDRVAISHIRCGTPARTTTTASAPSWRS